MTYRLDLANRAGLFRNYAAWYEDDNFHDADHMNMVYRIGSLVNSLEILYILRGECLVQFAEFESILRHEGQRIHFQSPTLYDIFTHVSSILTHLRIGQNILLNLISKKYGTSLPGSMNKFVQKGRKYQLKSTIIQYIISYWKNSGHLVKNYRDIDQHYSVLFKNAWIIKNENEIAFSIFFPDNPMVRSSKNFTYYHEIDVFEFLQSAFDAFHELINEISKMIGYINGRSFDYNIIFDKGMVESLAISFDPFRDTLIGQEIYRRDNKLHSWNRIINTDLSKYSFVRNVSYFDSTY